MTILPLLLTTVRVPALPRERTRPHPDVATRTALVITAVHMLASTLRYRFHGADYDLAIFYQALSSTSTTPFETLIKGPGHSIFGDHAHPIILLLWPLVQAIPSPVTLLAAQSLAIGLAVAVLAREFMPLLPTGERTLWLAGLALAPGIQGAAMFDFHEVSLGAPLLALVMVALHRRQHLTAALWAGSLVLIKEDAVLFIAGIALVLALRRSFGLALALSSTAVGWWLLATRWFIPWAAGTHYTYTSMLPTSPGELAQHLVGALLGWEGLTLALVLTSLAWRPLRSDLALAVVPYLLAIAATDNFRYQVLVYHYWLLPTIILAAAAGAAGTASTCRLGRLRRRLAVVCITAGILAGPITLGLGQVDWSSRADADAALASVPAGAHVAAEGRFTAQLSQHARVRLLEPGSAHDTVPDEVDWALLDTESRAHGAPGWTAPVLERLCSEGFTVVGEYGSILVLHKTWGR